MLNSVKDSAKGCSVSLRTEMMGTWPPVGYRNPTSNRRPQPFVLLVRAGSLGNS